MKQFLITVGGVLVGLVLFLVIGPIVVISLLASAAASGPPAPNRMVLMLDLREEMTDQRPQSPFAALGAPANVLDLITRIHAAAQDDRVRGLYVRAGTDGMAPAHAEEIRAALAEFQRSGRFVIAHAQNDGARTSLAGYSAIAGADEVWLQGVSEVMPMGLTAEQPFLGATLARYGITAQFETREEFKSAADNLTQTGYTPANRLQMQELLGSIYDTFLTNIAADRSITPAAARAAVEATPFTAQRAVALRLFDRLGQPAEAEARALERAGEDAQIVDIARYTPPRRLGGQTIAVVLGEGEIISGTAESTPFGDGQIMHGDDVARALLDASEDDDVRAIVFRVSSPGGSVVASDQILAALRTARSRGKRVIVSMGPLAASGGYYVAAEADEIVADATTITGSIGVIGGKLVIGPALDRHFSVRSDTVSVGSPLANMFSANQAFTPEGRAAFSGLIDRMYQEFIARVAAGRRLTPAQVRELARGRVWTGAQARQRGLVDHLGGFATAIERARALAEIGANERIQLRFYPAPRSPFEELGQLFGASAESARAALLLGDVLGDERVSALVRAARDRDANVRARAEAVEVR